MRPWMLTAALSAVALAILAPIIALVVGGLDVAANVAQLVSIPLAAVALVPVLVSLLVPHAPGDPNPLREAILTAVPIIIVAVGVIWAALVVTQGRSEGGASARPEGVPGEAPAATYAAPPTRPPATPRGTPRESTWIETFGEGALAPDRWRPFARPEILELGGGALAFTVDLPDDGRPVNGEILQPILPGWPIGQVQATISASQTGGLLAGGVVLFVQQESGKVTGFAYGPSEAGPVGSAWLCHREEGCGAQSDNFEQPGRFLFQQGQAVDVTITQTGSALRVSAGGLVSDADADPTPIQNVWLRVEAAPSDQWVASIDDLRLTRAAE
jgi:hypothetical protein